MMKCKNYTAKKNFQGRDFKAHLVHGVKNDAAHFAAAKGSDCSKRQALVCKHLRMVVFVVGLMGSFFLLDSLMLAVIHHIVPRNSSGISKLRGSQAGRSRYIVEEKAPMIMYRRLVALATTAVAKNDSQRNQFSLWKEPYRQASTWKPCADRSNLVQQVAFLVYIYTSSLKWLHKREKSGQTTKEILEKFLEIQRSIIRECKHTPDSKNCKCLHVLIRRCQEYHQYSLFNHVAVTGHNMKRTGFILVSANGGLNQQRVAVCNAVAVAALLNATLVLPKFLYSSVWKDTSQFGDIYQEDYFINFLKDDVNIVKELPPNLKTLDIEAIGSQITDMDIRKESKPIYFVKAVLPLLLKNGIVHFLGFGNRLAFDPMPSNLQRLRCKCNFHALKFVPRIQETGSLLVRRIRKYDSRLTQLDKQLLGKYMSSTPSIEHNISRRPSRYLALHMRFEMDMVAYSQCDFGGGEREREELQAYREFHFPTLVMQMRNRSLSPSKLRNLGRCPLTPEEAGLMLSALEFKHGTYMYLAGSHIYGGQSRMLPFTKLYPNLVTKEDLLTPSELAPFRNFSSQLAALDFIACAAADVFAMTDSGSQLSSLVTGFRAYHGRGRAPTLKPNKKRYAKILSENRTIAWGDFAERVRKMIEEGQRVRPRRRGRSIYRQPRSPGCMCRA